MPSTVASGTSNKPDKSNKLLLNSNDLVIEPIVCCNIKLFEPKSCCLSSANVKFPVNRLESDIVSHCLSIAF
jgi:hypothetical protein